MLKSLCAHYKALSACKTGKIPDSNLKHWKCCMVCCRGKLRAALAVVALMADRISYQMANADGASRPGWSKEMFPIYGLSTSATGVKWGGLSEIFWRRYVFSKILDHDAKLAFGDQKQQCIGLKTQLCGCFLQSRSQELLQQRGNRDRERFSYVEKTKGRTRFL